MRVGSFAFLVLTALAALGAPAHAQEELLDRYDPRMVALLPRYCIHTQIFRQRVPGGENRAEIDRLSSLMGPPFDAMHHYCWGLVNVNNATYHARTKRTREALWRASVGEFDYVLQRSSSSFILRPEILTKRAESLIRLGQREAAVLNLREAIKLKADYWPPYATLADLYRDLGDVKSARAVLEKGLEQSPGVAALKRRLDELGGAPRARESARPDGKPQPSPPPAAGEPAPPER